MSELLSNFKIKNKHQYYTKKLTNHKKGKIRKKKRVVIRKPEKSSGETLGTIGTYL